MKTIEFMNNAKIESIENEAFDQSSVKTVSIPSSVKQIGLNAFISCLNLRSVEFTENFKCNEKDDKPTEIQKHAFMMCTM